MDTALPQLTTPAADATQELLARLWQRSLPLVQERVATLEAAASSLNISADLRAHAIADAHKLAGSLGMFGYITGTDLAREIEQLLEAPGEPDSLRLITLTTALRATLFPAK